MTINFWNLWTIHKEEDTFKSPVDIFYNSNHPEIKDLFPIQKEILVEWYENYNNWKKDNLIQLDTGVWKTLIWLFAAEALRKNKKWKILYLCPDNFLIEQTIEKAEKYWIKVSSYYSSNFTNEELFLWNEAICITNYSTVFSWNKFKDIDVLWVIFDDSHSVVDLLEKKYSIEINEDNNKELLKDILNIFTKYDFIKNDIEIIKQRDKTTNSMVPLTLWWNNLDIIKELIDSHILKLWKEADYNLKNNWIYLKNNLDKCLCFLWVWKIEIALLYPDTNNNNILNDDIDKIFLSATVNNVDDFIRFFWVEPNVINIETPYRPDRMFLFTNIIKNKINNIEELIIENYNTFSKKSLILVPSKKDFEKFKERDNVDFVNTPAEMKEKIKVFKDSNEQTLIIANRYDWIDIEWDTWHFMIINNILSHSTLKNSFFSARLWNEKNEFIRSNFAWKITQAFWRTTRSSSDYSTIIIMWDKLNGTLLNSDNEKLFSRDLVEDLKIWKLLSSSINLYQDFLDFIKSNLEQEQGYKDYVKWERTKIKWKELISNEELNEKIEIANFERKINNHFLNNNYEKCIKLILNKEFEKLLTKYNILKLYWIYLLIATFSYIKLWFTDKAQECYDRWVWITPFLWEKNYKFKLNSKEKIFQIDNILKIKFNNNLIFNEKISASIFEENIEQLWLLLWFTSTRPEKSLDWITLDNLWVDEDNKVVIWLECKNEKISTINKSDNWQSLDHFEWIKNKYQWYNKFYYIVGDIKYRTDNTNPNSEFLLLGFKEIISIYNKLSYIYKNKDLFPNDLKQNLYNSRLLGLNNIFSKSNKIINLEKRN